MFVGVVGRPNLFLYCQNFNSFHFDEDDERGSCAARTERTLILQRWVDQCVSLFLFVAVLRWSNEFVQFWGIFVLGGAFLGDL